jgi:2,3-dihydroxybenzoate decarboxylase
MRKIAIEQHFVTYDTRQYAGSAHVPPQIWNAFESKLLDFEEHRLVEMDRLGIDMEVLSFGSPGIQGESDTTKAIGLARIVNDDLAKIIERFPTRFAGFASVATQDPSAAAKELERAVSQLGFKGVMISGQTLGTYLDDQRYWPLLETAERLGVPIYLHPAPGFQALPIYAGHSYLEGPMWSWGVETATHALRMIFAGVFDAFPKLTLVLGHMGEGLPFTLWRLDSRYKIAKFEKPLKMLPSEYIARNVAITTSGVCSDAPLLCSIAALGAERILFATDYPFESDEEAVHFMDKAPISETDRALIYHRNAERLLNIEP